MYTRNVRIELKADSVPEFAASAEEIFHLLRQQKGFQDEISLNRPGTE